jgi:hypothetical protein
MNAIQPPASTLAPVSIWSAALADYAAKKAFSDALPMDDEEASDAAIDAYCNAMDHLVVNVGAPDLDALAQKIQLATDRWQYVGVPNAWLDGFLADVPQFAPEGR